MREFCKGLTRAGLWLVCVFLALAPHASFADALTQMEAYFTAPESVSGWVDTARGGAFTNTGHYVTLIAADEESLYVLDPLCRETYKTNYAGKLHIHQPGYVSLLLEDVKYARLSSFMLFEKQ